jgi:hypothetical protein
MLKLAHVVECGVAQVDVVRIDHPTSFLSPVGRGK